MRDRSCHNVVMKINYRGSVKLHRRNRFCGYNGEEGSHDNEEHEEVVGNDRRNASLVVYFLLNIPSCLDSSATFGTTVSEV